ncbi:MAG: hypothetical protein WBG43_13170 [Marinifilaceae bacterium]
MKKDQLVLDSICEYLGVKLSFCDLIPLKDRIKSVYFPHNKTEQYYIDGNFLIEFMDGAFEAKHSEGQINFTSAYRKPSHKGE